MPYRATLAASLTDLGGGEPGRDFSWSFSTPPPKVLSVTPSSGTRWVAHAPRWACGSISRSIWQIFGLAW